ncbi:MAG: 50S ribosomal protein L21 [Candidatus Limnocylindria bacterium]
MYAVVRSGSKQYRVEKDALITVPRLAGEPGATVTLGQVLLVADGDTVNAGAPSLDGATVTAEIVAHGKGEKIRVFRYKNKTRSRKLTGSRARQTTLRITKITT